jgi:hypothetical protein
MSYDAPFAGLKVVDLSQGVAGPYCGMLLAQHGADVIKVEPTGEGDWSRTLGRRYGGHTAYSIPTNLGKRSIALDLKSDEGKDVLWRLIGGADVLLEGFRPGVLDRLGFGYAAVAKREPRILYLSVSGFGQTGPLAGRPAMDPVLQAFTGLMMDNKGEAPQQLPRVPDTASGGGDRPDRLAQPCRGARAHPPAQYCRHCKICGWHTACRHAGAGPAHRRDPARARLRRSGNSSAGGKQGRVSGVGWVKV